MCRIRLVCSLSVVAFNLRCFGSDLRPFEMELLHFMLFLWTMTAMFNIKVIMAFSVNKYVYVCVYFHNDFWNICVKKCIKWILEQSTFYPNLLTNEFGLSLLSNILKINIVNCWFPFKGMKSIQLNISSIKYLKTIYCH